MSQIQETNPDLATKGPLPDGWTTEYSPQWNAWFYVDTKAANPQAVWTHPLDKNANPSTPSPEYTAEPHAGHSSTSAAPADQPTNPDTRPLPPGWVSQYNPDHKTFFYVNETAADPGSTVTWTHPADAHPPATDLKSPATAATHAGVGSAVAAPGYTGELSKTAPTDHAGAPPNLPAGWKAELDTNYKAWYYINTNDPSAGPTWTPPADVHSAVPPAASQQTGAAPPITTQPSYTGISPKKTTEPLPSTTSAAPGGTIPNSSTENPDKRPLPPGWITKYDENYKVWYYVDTTKPGNVASWEHPAEKTNTSGAPAAGGTAAPGSYNAGDAPPANQQYGGQASPTAEGGGIEGLIGGSAGKMVSGLFGAKGRAQMDMFANKLSPEVNKLKGKFAGGSSSGPGQGHSGAPPAGAPGQYGAPPAQGQYGAPPTTGQAPYGSPPSSQGQYGASPPGQGKYGAPPTAPQAPYGSPPSSQGQYGAPPPPGQGKYGAPPTAPQAPYSSSPPSGQGQYGSPPTPAQAPYGSSPPPGQGPYGAPGGQSSMPGQGPPPGQPGQYSAGIPPPSGGGYGAPPPVQAPQGQGGQGGSLGSGGLNSLAEKFGKFGLGKK